MFYIKNDDIEELFREAAEKYHLDTTAAEAWDDVQAAVHADDAPPPPPPGKRRKKRWFILGWLLLIPVGWFAHNIWSAISQPSPNTNTKQFTKPATQKQINDIGLSKKQGITVDKKQESINIDDKKHMAVATTPKYNNNGGNLNNTLTNQSNKLATKKGVAIMHVKTAGIVGDSLNAKPGKSHTGLSTIYENRFQGATPTSYGALAKKHLEAGIPPTNQNLENKAGNTEKPVMAMLLPKITATNNSTITPTPATDTISYKSESIKPGKQLKQNKNNHYFYTGLVVAPDVSFIHNQKTSQIGVGAGLLLGYKINKNLSVESGLLLEKKYYYTKGEYFNTRKIPYFNTRWVKLKSAEGNCNMVEIPVNLKYTFKARGGNHFYAIGGLSSYLMGHEKYTFDYTDWGTPAQKTWGYNNKSNYLFSIINLGVGYEKMLGAKTNLRVEPYLKLPLSGVGTGSLKIASTGLYFTLTRKIP